ncbi:MAG TPA: TetR/AcrR family transcriptional regulator [Sphingobium sp.]|uniref:TetR/AcrR family transcriptional regulator n=1 Tax=Sphingobium sp. TaxID=1912891 RepID=UPI002ED1B00A
MVERTSPSKMRRERAARLTAEQRREEILAVATRLISQSGFNGVSQADIASACGVGKSLVTHYFSSMKALLAAVLDAKDMADFAALSDATYPPNQPGPVRAFFTKHIENNMERWEIIRLHRMLDAEALDPEHPAHAYFVDRYHRTREVARELLAFKGDPECATHELLAFWHGLELEWVRNRDLPVLSIWNTFADRFFSSGL